VIKEAISYLFDLGESKAVPVYVTGANVPLVNGKAMPELVFNDHTERPERIEQAVSVLDAASFCEYFSHFKDPDSRVFAYEPNITVVGVVDYHEVDPAIGDGGPSPRWCSHVVTLTLQQSEQWKTWFGSNNKQFTQQAFAEFLEQNAMDITKPSPAAVMDVARDLEGSTECEFGAGVRMRDGSVKFKYTETTKATVGGSELQVPDAFLIGIPVFVGGPPVEVECLLRFRVSKEGKLTIFYTLVRPEEAKRQAFLQQRNAIEESLAIKVINGKHI
jgi:uncharacterized protein YfdQ (DUF2303 family)